MATMGAPQHPLRFPAPAGRQRARRGPRRSVDPEAALRRAGGHRPQQGRSCCSRCRTATRRTTVRNHPKLQGHEHPEDRSARQRRRADHQDAGHRRRPAGHRAAATAAARCCAPTTRRPATQVGEVLAAGAGRRPPDDLLGQRPPAHHRRRQRRQLHRRVHLARACRRAWSAPRRPLLGSRRGGRGSCLAEACVGQKNEEREERK